MTLMWHASYVLPCKFRDLNDTVIEVLEFKNQNLRVRDLDDTAVQVHGPINQVLRVRNPNGNVIQV